MQTLAHPVASGLIFRRFLLLFGGFFLCAKEFAERVHQFLWRRNKDVDQAFLCVFRRLFLDLFQFLPAHHTHGCLYEIPHDGFNVASDISDLCELRRLDLEKGRTDETGKAAGDLRFADTRRADHEDVLRNDVLAHIGIELPAAPAVAQGDGDGALRFLLADNIFIQFCNNLARCLFVHADRTHDSSTSTVML